jgi:Tetratricopeptide repeat
LRNSLTRIVRSPLSIAFASGYRQSRHINRGEPDAPAELVAAWPHADLDDMIPTLEAFMEFLHAHAKTGSDPPSGRFTPLELETFGELASLTSATEPDEILKQGALLHADIAMLVGSRATAFSGRSELRRLRRKVGQGVVARAPDADYRGMESGGLHWDVARVLLDEVPKPSADVFVRDWYRAIAAFFASRYMFGEAKPHFERALKIFPSDAYLLYSRACFDEALASPGVQAFVAATMLPGGFRLEVDSAGDHYGRAEDLLVRALKVDPGLTEAKVRLARVHAARGRYQEASLTLRDALDDVDDSIVKYYALMFLGSAELMLDRDRDAQAAFEAAADLFPRAQSPRLALSVLARRRNDIASASRAVIPPLALTNRDSADEPWWDYRRGEGRYVDRLLDMLRQPFRHSTFRVK